jgi:hypothetical protein
VVFVRITTALVNLQVVDTCRTFNRMRCCV